MVKSMMDLFVEYLPTAKVRVYVYPLGYLYMFVYAEMEIVQGALPSV